VYQSYKKANVHQDLGLDDQFTYKTERHTMVSFVSKHNQSLLSKQKSKNPNTQQNFGKSLFSQNTLSNQTTQTTQFTLKDTFTRIKFLVETVGCNPNTLDNFGYGCLVYSIRLNNYSDLENFLKLKNINKNILDSNNKSLAHHVVNPCAVGSYEAVDM